ncbi:MAG: hypothetical protein HY744_11700 [Deltaproteobacteria bacterium]|nr:hypothetical protein [Deltaproteobacteria bacterium]
MPIEDYHPRFDSFRSLMPNRVRQVLLVSSLYDAFVLEEDGTLGDRLWDQYVEQRLTMVPAVRRVSTGAHALGLMEREPIDLVMAMTRLSDGDPFAFAAEVKKRYPHMPVVLLVTDPSELRRLPPPAERASIDKVFLWNNYSGILLAIVKYIEDRANVDHDTQVGGVRVIVLIEDSCAYYSTFLPAMYTVIMDLTRNLIADGLNELHKQLRTRSRAKVLLAETYEEGMELLRKYRPYLVGAVCDVEFWRGGVVDPQAGFELTRAVRAEMPDLPIVLQSADPEKNRQRTRDLGALFIDKNSPALLDEFRSFLTEYLGFGDFVFRMPDGQEVARARNVHEMLDILHRIPSDSLLCHAERNDFSHWMAARTELTIADRLRPKRVADFDDHEAVRRYIIDVIRDVLADKQSDVVAEFSAEKAMAFGHFLHLGKGSLGGKGRAIAFLRFLLARSKLSANYPGVRLGVPAAVVIGAGEFADFIDDNKLRRFALECDDREEITHRFLQGTVREPLVTALRSYLGHVTGPLAVRSSSLLEDSHLQPFAGLYATVMIPNLSESLDRRLEQLLHAVKEVWASTYCPDAKAYFRATVHRMEEEEMAVIVQLIAGQRHGDHFYPTLSGVAQSYNFYPISHMSPEDGAAQLALGLGKMVVEGGAAVRFCPRYPEILPQFPRPEDWLRSGQKQFYALRLTEPPTSWDTDPDATLALLDLKDAEDHGVLQRIGSVYCSDDRIIRDGLCYRGPRVVTFSSILKHHEIPLPEILADLLATCREALGCPVEIEFAVNVGPYGTKPLFSLLQVRPLIAAGERDLVALSDAHRDAAWCFTYRALGNGIKKNIRDLVFVRRSTFERSRTREVADEVGKINRHLEAAGRPYLLIGFGRWGTFDPWLGIGVSWAQISGVAVLVEAGLPDFEVDPSQGTHFFHNLTTLDIGYLSVPHGNPRAKIEWEWLESLPVEQETRYVRHVRLSSPIEVRIDGRSGEAVALRETPRPELQSTGSGAVAGTTLRNTSFGQRSTPSTPSRS